MKLNSQWESPTRPSMSAKKLFSLHLETVFNQFGAEFNERTYKKKKNQTEILNIFKRQGEEQGEE